MAAEIITVISGHRGEDDGDSTVDSEMSRILPHLGRVSRVITKGNTSSVREIAVAPAYRLMSSKPHIHAQSENNRPVASIAY